MVWSVAYQRVENLGEVLGGVVGGATSSGYDEPEWDIGLVNFGLAEESWASGAGRS